MGVMGEHGRGEIPRVASDLKQNQAWRFNASLCVGSRKDSVAGGGILPLWWIFSFPLYEMLLPECPHIVCSQQGLSRYSREAALANMLLFQWCH